jgi:Spy/CpxP family protein refolding chaperone
MKETLVRFGMGAFVAIAMSGNQNLALSQQPSKQDPPTGNLQGMAISVGGMDGMDRLEFLSNLLALTPGQQEQAKAILDDEKAALKPLLGQMKQASDDLNAAEKKDAPDDQMDQLASSVASVYGQMLSLEAKAASKIYLQLTPKQRQKLDQLPPPPAFIPLASVLGPLPMVGEVVTFHTRSGTENSDRGER